jgi:single-stranded DNA-binding protein
VTISGGVVADPERPSDKIVKFRLAVDYAGREKDSDDRSGYFDVVYYLDDTNPNSKFVSGQLAAGNLKKGSGISVVGRLEHDRFKTKEGTKASRVQIIADAISYWGRKPLEASASNGGAQAAASSGSTPPPAQSDEELLPAPADF